MPATKTPLKGCTSESRSFCKAHDRFQRYFDQFTIDSTVSEHKTKDMSRGCHSGLRVCLLAGYLLAAFSTSHGSGLPPIPDLAERMLDNQGVREAYEKARSNSANAEFNGLLGVTLHAHEQYELASFCYQRAQHLEPESFRWAYYLGLANAALGRKAEAIAALRRAVQLDSGYLPASLKLADTLAAVGDFDESQKIYHAAVKHHVNSALGHYGLGRVQTAKGEHDAAAESYAKACQLFPEFGAAHYALGIIYRNRGERTKAQEQLSLFERFRQREPPLEDPLFDAMKALRSDAVKYFNEGVRLEEQGRINQAVAEYQRALEKDPRFAQAHGRLLSVCLALGQLGKAEEHYHAAVKIDPMMYKTHHNYGTLLQMQGRNLEAADAMRKAVEINPFYAEGHNNLGYVLATLGKLDDAATHFRLAIENNPNFVLAHFNLGRVLLTQGKSLEAIEHLQKTIELENHPSAPLFMYTLAVAYTKVGNRQKAVDFAQRAKQGARARGQTTLAEDIDKFLQQSE